MHLNTPFLHIFLQQVKQEKHDPQRTNGGLLSQGEKPFKTRERQTFKERETELTMSDEL